MSLAPPSQRRELRGNQSDRDSGRGAVASIRPPPSAWSAFRYRHLAARTPDGQLCRKQTEHYRHGGLFGLHASFRESGLLRGSATASGNLTALLGSQGFGASFPALASRSLASGIDVLLLLLADDDVAHLDDIRVLTSGTLLTVGSNGHDSSPLSMGGLSRPHYRVFLDCGKAPYPTV